MEKNKSEMKDEECRIIQEQYFGVLYVLDISPLTYTMLSQVIMLNVHTKNPPHQPVTCVYYLL